ncbi:MAG: hypothetical protein HZA77_08190 [Candidatus Schekmanbacteria bacterium]|nr:hypothetical protein [Candidatus Schekmanbacteria bacterium]
MESVRIRPDEQGIGKEEADCSGNSPYKKNGKICGAFRERTLREERILDPRFRGDDKIRSGDDNED